MKTAYFDCFAGVAGDMTLGALIDLGADRARLEAALASLGLEGYRLEIGPASKHGIGATRVQVHVEAPQPERHLHHIEASLARGDLPGRSRELALRVFRRLAEAEARVHRVSVERVHLHEVGAVDAMVDIVGSAVALELLGIERVIASPVTLGRGLARGEHGPLPVPGPATLELLRGVPVREGPVEAELTTPTGAAILSTVSEAFGPLPTLRVEGIGYGAGTRDFPDLPNLLRVVVGEPEPGTYGERAESVVLLETNLDDASPQVLGWVQELALERGALDAWTVPATMKKSRPGHLLSILAPPERVSSLLELLFRETTTLGVRVREERRLTLGRRHQEVRTPFGPVRVKVASRGGDTVNAAPEYEDAAARARQAGVPLKEVQRAALAALEREGPAAGSTGPERAE